MVLFTMVSFAQSTLTALRPTYICTGQVFTYNPTSLDDGATFTWNRATIIGVTEPGTTGTGYVSETLTNTTTNPVDVTYDYTTTYNSVSTTEEVIVTIASNPCTPPPGINCIGYDTVVVYDTVLVSVQDTLTFTFTLTGVAAPNNTVQIQVYPNPTQGNLTINLSGVGLMSGYTMELKNPLGQTVFTADLQAITSLDFSAFVGSGVYILSILDDNSNIISTKYIAVP